MVDRKHLRIFVKKDERYLWKKEKRLPLGRRIIDIGLPNAY